MPSQLVGLIKPNEGMVGKRKDLGKQEQVGESEEGIWIKEHSSGSSLNLSSLFHTSCGQRSVKGSEQ